MKRFLFFCLLCLSAVWPFSARAEESGFTSPVIQELIKVEESQLKYKNKVVPIPFTRKNLIKVFGKPSREIYNTAGTVVIWDELGLTCYGCQKKDPTPEEFAYMSEAEKKQAKQQDYVDSITLFVRKYNPYPERENEYSHEPHHPFAGKVMLDGVELDGELRFEDFVERRKGNQTILLPKNSFSFYIRCKPTPHEITLHTIRNKYSEDYMSIYSISIRNIGHYYKNYKCFEIFEVPQPVKSGQ